ncbi:putative endonuclease V [Trypanosoma theileri]|uniref:Putative endonuclease V n=1 Tax=Trypanosoma theileri TaxID=67003 RepID=A0A1X0P8I3_9TRYP|nr:putative endonuclease V [Trypanosoma theileri]ORC92933.1 putative endonuclease V [Trypanosoma theileri]
MCNAVCDTKKRGAWTVIQQELAERVCVPRTEGTVELYSNEEEDDDEKKYNSFVTFMFPHNLLKEYSSTVLGPQLYRGFSRCSSLSPCFSILPVLRYVGGVDVSFVKGSSLAVASLVILEYPSMQRLRVFLHHCEVTEPYIPGFLAFREVGPIIELIGNARGTLMKEGCFPQLLLVDGCGVHHPFRCGLASHLGVKLDIPTIGCAKNFMSVDGITRERMNELFTTAENKENHSEISPVVKPIIGQSGLLWGYAITPNSHVKKPIFVSPGHRIGYAEATALVLSMCKHRVPEPIRAADSTSRECIRLMTVQSNSLESENVRN